MICPKDLVQMHQKDKIGGGESTDEKYLTWSLQECPSCGRLVREYYEAMVVENLSDVDNIVSYEELEERVLELEEENAELSDTINDFNTRD